MLKDSFVFIAEGIKEFQSTGTLFASSKWAALALTTPLREISEPRRLLEVGPGSGSVTVQILKQMVDTDELVICEINPRFMKALKRNLSTNPDFLRHQERISFYECPVQDLPEVKKFDIIVCAIPFLNLPIDVVQDIFAKFKRLSETGAVMTYYEYIGLRRLGKVVSPPERKQRLRALDSFFAEVYEEHNMRRKREWRNLLPINIYTLQIAA